MNFFWWLPFGRVPEIPAETLSSQLQGQPAPVIIDVRTHKEFDGCRIAGAINVPVTELRAKLDSLNLDKGLPVVAICRSAHRSIPAVRLLKAKGFENACQLEGGMIAWRKAGLQVEGDDIEGLTVDTCDVKNEER